MLLLIASCIAAWAVWQLIKTKKQRQIAYNRYMDDRVINNHQQEFLIAPNGDRIPTWCPNCGKNL